MGKALCENGLRRRDDAEGAAVWANALRTGAMTRGDVLMAFAQSEEAQHHLRWAL